MNKTTTYIAIACTMLSATAFATQESLCRAVPDSIDTHSSLQPEETISCINLEADTITFNGADWSPFFSMIEHIQDSAQTEQKSISIIHLGDSHIQAGYFTEAMRIPLQEAWGNAGRGLITP